MSFTGKRHTGGHHFSMFCNVQMVMAGKENLKTVTVKFAPQATIQKEGNLVYSRDVSLVFQENSTMLKAEAGVMDIANMEQRSRLDLQVNLTVSIQMKCLERGPSRVKFLWK